MSKVILTVCLYLHQCAASLGPGPQEGNSEICTYGKSLCECVNYLQKSGETTGVGFTSMSQNCVFLVFSFSRDDLMPTYGWKVETILLSLLYSPRWDVTGYQGVSRP